MILNKQQGSVEDIRLAYNLSRPDLDEKALQKGTRKIISR